MACFAIALIASGSNSSSTLSISKSFLYCFTSAFLGSVSILTRASSESSLSVTIAGSLPINSGISPNFSKSSGCICLRISSSSWFCETISALKPIVFSPILLCIILSSPSNAPPHMKRTLVVSNCMNSCCGCLRPP